MTTTTATTSDIKAALANLEAALTGIRYAYARLPRGELNSVDCPQFLNFAREGNYDMAYDISRQMGSDTGYISRLYLAQLMVMPDQEGITWGEAEETTEPFIDTVRNFFMQHPSLGGLNGVRAYPEGDTGVRKLQWNAQVFWGVEFRIRIIQIVPRTYAADE